MMTCEQCVRSKSCLTAHLQVQVGGPFKMSPHMLRLVYSAARHLLTEAKENGRLVTQLHSDPDLPLKLHSNMWRRITLLIWQ